MPRLEHDEYYLRMLLMVSLRSTCPRRAVGAIIVDTHHRVLSTGFNGVPRGVTHCIDVPCPGVNDERGNTTRCEAVHAEMNAVLQCADLERAWKLYVSCVPCFECAKVIANTGIEIVIAAADYPGPGLEMLQRCGIAVEIQNEKLP